MTEHDWHADPYAGDADRDAMIGLVAESAVADFGAGYVHPGDVCWRLVQLLPPDPADAPHRRAYARGTPAELVRLWRDADGRLSGFAWFSPPNEFEWQIRPELRDDPGLVREIIAWGEERRTETTPTGGEAEPPAPLQLSVYSGDTVTRDVLAGLGWAYAPNPVHDLYRFERDLAGAPIVPAPLADGFTIRPVAGPEEHDARIAIHREVWAPSAFNAGRYAATRAAPPYRPGLDLVVVAPDGQLAAYCIVWYDPVSRTGEFEPVGTHPDFRGRGLGRAMIVEGQRRLQALGARTAIVYTYAQTAPAVALYRSAGFTTVGTYGFHERR